MVSEIYWISVHLGFPHISETTRARKFKFYTPLDGGSTLYRYENFSDRDRAAGIAPHSSSSFRDVRGSKCTLTGAAPPHVS